MIYISSVYAARQYLLDGDFYICEADLYVSDTSIFEMKLNHSCYYGKMIKGHSDDWVFDQDENGMITRVGKSGDDCYNMTGITFFKADDARALYNAISGEYGRPGYETMFWDDVVNKHIGEFNLMVHAVEHSQIVEIDTVAELEEVNRRVADKEI